MGTAGEGQGNGTACGWERGVSYAGLYVSLHVGRLAGDVNGNGIGLYGAIGLKLMYGKYVNSA